MSTVFVRRRHGISRYIIGVARNLFRGKPTQENLNISEEGTILISGLY